MHIIKLDAIDSTNDYLRRLIRENKPEKPTVVSSHFQHKGRGQRGQAWSSQAGKNLMFSLYLPNFSFASNAVFMVHKLVSVCLLEWLSSFQIPKTSIKWPNDILSGDHKLAGILIESSSYRSMTNSIVIGVGLNVNQIEFQNLPYATSMQLLTAKNYDIDELLFSLTNRLIQYLTNPAQNFEQIYQKSIYGLGRKRLFRSDHKEFEGVIQAVNPEGKLVVRTAAAERLFDVKELQFLHVADQ
jgi:BirA family biotin operon repressor/biotin-[acetyl-CoA-carboxylase] ligase